MVSLHSVQKDYLKQNFSLETIIELFKEWVSEDTRLILSKWNKIKFKNDIFAVKCSKRGNDVYSSRVKTRFKGLTSEIDDISFFNPKDRGNKTTRALFVTLTNDPKKRSIDSAWFGVGMEFNRFMSMCRRNYGKISSIRVFESGENGYPHIHCILLFDEYNYSVFKDSKGQFRVHEKDIIAQGWSYGFVDVKALSSLSGGFSYLKKYLLKGIDLEKADTKGLKTLALCWIHNKRAFSVSGKFRQALFDLIANLHNSNKHLIQITLLGQKIPEEQYSLLGFVAGKDIKIESDVWFTVLDSEQVTLLNQFLREPYVS